MSKRKDCQQAGVCPKCGKHDLDYGTSYPQDNMVCYPWECCDCRQTGEEWHELRFVEHTWDKGE